MSDSYRPDLLCSSLYAACLSSSFSGLPSLTHECMCMSMKSVVILQLCFPFLSIQGFVNPADTYRRCRDPLLLKTRPCACHFRVCSITCISCVIT